MQYVAIERLGAMWPDATIQVLSDAPSRMPVYCPNAVPLSAQGRRTWLHGGFLRCCYSDYLPKQILSCIEALECYLRRHWPSLVELILKLRAWWSGSESAELQSFLGAVSTADLVVAVGMGGVADAFPGFAADLLDTLKLAKQRGALTAMVGQGIGPIKEPKLRALTRTVLPHVDFISLREDRAGGPLLKSLGVPPDRVMTTGDDAIELAYRSRSEEIGDGLGVSLRAAPYSEVGHDLIAQLRSVLQNAAKVHDAPMVPVPISRHPGEEDFVTIRELMTGYGDLSDAGEKLDTWQKVIDQVGRCRVVVAGSYHAGVFALSQGISVVGLAGSDYYVDKFLGLADQFGAGCEVIILSDAQLSEKLVSAIDRAWLAAEELRPHLLEAAACQVERSKAAYRRIHNLVLAQRMHWQEEKCNES